tara:strand:- start:1829 stop:2260 length:432 start_codon:yes stop_codon:yes gene_type:complete
VAQQFPTTAQVIYDVLAADNTFTGLLGTYSFKAGQSATALSIVSAGEDLPSLRNVQGVECVIQDTGNISKSEYLSADPARVSVTWSVFLIAWEPAKGSDLQAVAQHLCSRFLGSNSLETVATADGLGSLVQTKVQIRSDMPII